MHRAPIGNDCAMGLKKSFKDSEIKEIQYDSNLKIYTGGGCNSIVLLSEDEKQALVVDTKYFKGARKLRKEISAPDITIVNTHFHIDHARGNKLYPDAYVISGACSWCQWDFDTGRSKRPDKVMTPGEEISLKIGNENVRILNMGNVHSFNDCVVYLESRKMLIAGDVIWVKVHPMVMDPNCSISLWLKALDKIESVFDIKTIVPGHGDVSDKFVLTEMREYFLSITNALNDPDKLKLLKQKYKDYKKVPVVTGFDKTVKKIRKELKISNRMQ